MRIAVGTDFSDRSREAFPVAASLAKKLSAELCVVSHVELTVLTEPPPFSVEGIFEAAEEKLAGLIESQAAFQGLEVVPLLVRGGDIRRFGEALAEHGVDLLVTATHGHTGLKRFLLGSFAQKALRFAPCPVLVLRRREGESDGGEFTPRRILAPHDLSDLSREAVGLALDWCGKFDAETRLLHVIDETPGVSGLAVDIGGGWHEHQEREREVAREQLERLARAHPKLRTEVRIKVGHPVAEILDEAEDFRADLIVLGSRGKTGLEYFYLGSVAEKTVRRAPCSVLVLKAAAKEQGTRRTGK